MDFGEWVKYGVDKGWVTCPFCNTHDGGPLTEEEREFEEGGDPCLVMMRVWHGM